MEQVQKVSFLDVARLANSLLAQHSLDGWKFRYDRAKKRAGCCKYRPKTITLSYHYVTLNAHKPDDIRDTLLHEIAHALAGPGTHHGPIWKMWCRKIGARPVRCYDVKDVTMPKGKYVAACPKCTRVYHKHKKPTNVTGTRYYYCRPCGRNEGRLDFTITK